MRAVPKPEVVRDAKWLKVVRQMPCWGRRDDVHGHQCGDTLGKGLSEASHLDSKSRDDRVLPMCGFLHRTGPMAWHHGQATFCLYHEVTKAELIAEAEALYRTYQETI